MNHAEILNASLVALGVVYGVATFILCRKHKPCPTKPINKK